MLSFSLQIDAAHPPSGAAEDSKKVQFSLDEAPQPIVTRIKKTLMNLDFAVKVTIKLLNTGRITGGITGWITRWINGSINGG